MNVHRAIVDAAERLARDIVVMVLLAEVERRERDAGAAIVREVERSLRPSMRLRGKIG